MKNSFF
jgi:hypothetical protein